MDRGIDWGGDYSRFSFDELKRYLMMLKEQGVPVLDDEFNLLQEILLTVIRRVVADSFGDGSVTNGFLIAGTGASNNFTIKGGDGTAGGAGRLYLSGYPIVLAQDTTYAAQPIAQAALTTPSANRLDEVYIDAWLDEVDNSNDPAIIDPSMGIETSRRLKLLWKVKVAEGSTTPPAFVDGNALPHYTLLLAKINRTATAAINASMVVDKRNSNRRTDARIDHVITEAAITLDKNDKTQLKAAILAITGAGASDDIMTITASVTLTASSPDRVLVNAASGAITITLPAASSPALRFTFMRTDTSVNAVTISSAGADTIEGVATWPLNVYGRMTLANDKVAQWVRADNEIATAAEVQAGAIAHKTVTPATLVASQTQKGILEIASNAEVAAGVDTVRAVTPAGLAQALPKLLAANGFITLPGGLIVQWGEISLPANALATVTLPAAFPSRFAAASASFGEANNTTTGDVFITRLSLTQFSIRSSREATVLAHWIAIGY